MLRQGLWRICVCLCATTSSRETTCQCSMCIRYILVVFHWCSVWEKRHILGDPEYTWFTHDAATWQEDFRQVDVGFIKVILSGWNPLIVYFYISSSRLVLFFFVSTRLPRFVCRAFISSWGRVTKKVGKHGAIGTPVQSQSRNPAIYIRSG
jgi:hypothetical protein